MRVVDSILGFFGRGQLAASKESVSNGSDLHRSERNAVRGAYDLAQTHPENERHFALADNLSAKAANSPSVRGIMRRRSRYEAACNPQFKRILKAYVKDVIGTGPRIQLATGHEAFDHFTGKHWRRWTKSVRYVRKLRLSLRGRVVNGESFRQRITNPELSTAVKLDIKPFEADRCSSLFENAADPLKVDGIDFDQYGNPQTYWITDHPGDLSAMRWKPRPISAKYITHWFEEEREEQVRGVPELHSSVELMADGRRFRKATRMKAESAASTNGVIYADVAAGAMPDDFEDGPFEFDRNTDHVMPVGWKREEYEQKSPNDTYEMFNRETASEAGAPLGMTANVSTGNSSQYNFSSTRYDGEHWFGEVECQREDCELIVVNPDFQAWFAEFILTADYLEFTESDLAADQGGDGTDVVTLEDAVLSVQAGDAVEWEWDGHPQVDQVKSATGSDMDIAGGRSSTETEAASYGRNARTELAKEAKYLGMTVEQCLRGKRIQRFGFDPCDPKSMPPGSAPATPQKLDSGEKSKASQTHEDDAVPSKIRQRSRVPAGGSV